MQEKEFTAKTVVITGASDGIGAEAARQLKALGHFVVLVGRNATKTEKIAKELGAPYHLADFSRLSDVVRLASELSAYPKIDVLANNAGGIMQKERTLTQDGVELTFQVNVLAPFLLTELLKEKLIASEATVIQTSSIASNLFGRKLDLTDIQNERSYTAVKAYGEAKLCDVLLTRELQRRYGGQGLCAVAFEPGIPRTNFASDGPAFFRIMYHSPMKYLFTCSREGSAARLVRLAVGERGKDFLGGQVYSAKKPYKIRYRAEGKSEELWNICERLTEKIRSANPEREKETK